MRAASDRGYTVLFSQISGNFWRQCVLSTPTFSRAWVRGSLRAIKARLSFLHAGSGPHHWSEKALENFCLIFQSIYFQYIVSEYLPAT